MTYKACMASNMGGGKLKGLSKDERKLAFCVIAKKCSKGMSEKEAVSVCQNTPHKAKAPKSEGGGNSRHMYYDPDDGAPQIPDGYEVAE